MKMLPDKDCQPVEEHNQKKSVPERAKSDVPNSDKREQGTKCSCCLPNGIFSSQLIILNNCTFQTLQIFPKQLDNNDTSVLDKDSKTDNKVFEIFPSNTNDQGSYGGDEHGKIELNGCTFEILNLRNSQMVNNHHKITLNKCTFSDLNVSPSNISDENNELPIDQTNQLSKQNIDFNMQSSESEEDNMHDIKESFSNIDPPKVEQLHNNENIAQQNRQRYDLQQEIKVVVENRMRAEKLNEFRNRFVEFERNTNLRRPAPNDYRDMYETKTISKLEAKNRKPLPETVNYDYLQEPLYESVDEIKDIITFKMEQKGNKTKRSEIVVDPKTGYLEAVKQKGKTKRPEIVDDPIKGYLKAVKQKAKTKRSEIVVDPITGYLEVVKVGYEASKAHRPLDTYRYEIQDPVPETTNVALWTTSNFRSAIKTDRKRFQTKRK